jgi:hypothetical protein
VRLRLEFVGADAVPRQEFRLIEQNGGYQLPGIVLRATGHAWVEDTAIVSCAAPPGAPPGAEALRAALLDAWGNAGPAGHGTLLSSAGPRVAAEHVTEPVELRVTWAVTWYDTGIYQRFQNSAEPFREESTVSVNFEPARRAAVPPPAAPPPARPGEVARNRGFVAVDFGTSYSTAALFEQQYLPPVRPLSSMQASQLRAEIIGLLGGNPQWGPEARHEFAEFVAEIATGLLPDVRGATDPQRHAALQRALTEDDNDEPRLLYAVLLELERRVPQSSEALRPALAAALNAIYSRAWRVPPLDRLRLFEVMLDVNEGSVIESKATATVSPLAVLLGRGADDDDDGGPRTHVYAGQKGRLSKAEQHPELGPGITSDDLIREALRDIVRRCNAFIGAGPRELGTGRVSNVVITFPTMATPPVRRKLADMLRAVDIPLVDNSLDEAIAAAMFTVLRDFGSDYEIGIELLRSQSREVVPDKKWKQNLLVIDIGGGTTDIALLGLHLQDETPEEAITGSGRHGRYYQLLPEVLGSTGKLQLGGELMTLRVFYWIKAVIADQLLRLSPHTFDRPLRELRQIVKGGDIGERPLLAMTKGKLPTFHRGGTSSGDVFDVLDRVVPTRSAPGYGRPSQAFWLLWRIADQVKLDFCAPRPPEEISLRPVEVRRVLQVADWASSGASGPPAQAIRDEDLTIALARQDFERLIERDLGEVMSLAYGLAAERLAASGEPVDRIILTGQTSRAPLVRRRLLEEFGRQGTAAKSLRWEQKSVSVVEGRFAKLATSLGACWTKSNRGLVPRPRGAIADLKAGRNVFSIKVDNLFFNLPCTFLRGKQLGGTAKLPHVLTIGAEMFQAYPDQDIAVLRSEPFELTGIVAIFREAQGNTPRWADFQWEVTESEQQLTLNRSIWPDQIMAVLEATSNLDLSLLLYRGRAHYEVGGPATSVLDAAAAAAGVARAPERSRFWSKQRPTPAEEEAKQEFDPSRIMVNAYSGDGDHRGTAVFPGPDDDDPVVGGTVVGGTVVGGPVVSGPPTGDEARPTADVRFAEWFHTSAGRGRESAARGAVSVPLPEPPSGGSWSFHYRDDKGGLHHIGEFQPPPRQGQLAIRYYATVDEQGDLRVHAGEVPFWPAASLAEVQDRPGSVYHAPMVSTADDYEPERDPFNGRH